MLDEVRKFLETRIKLVRQERDSLVGENVISLSLVSDNFGTIRKTSSEIHSEKLVAAQSALDELVRIANFLDFVPVVITEDMSGNRKLEVASVLLFRDYLEWLKVTQATWDDLGGTETGSPPSHYKMLATFCKWWYKKNESDTSI